MHVLIVDDNAQMAKFASRVITRESEHTVDVALTTPEALEMGLSNRYDCIFIEFRLPREEIGYKLAEVLREKGYYNLIIALVTLTHTFTVESMIKAGFNACLKKPLMKEDLWLIEMDPTWVHFGCPDLIYEKDVPFWEKRER